MRFWGIIGELFESWVCAVGEPFGGLACAADELHGWSVCTCELLLGVVRTSLSAVCARAGAVGCIIMCGRRP